MKNMLFVMDAWEIEDFAIVGLYEKVVIFPKNIQANGIHSNIILVVLFTGGGHGPDPGE